MASYNFDTFDVPYHGDFSGVDNFPEDERWKELEASEDFFNSKQKTRDTYDNKELADLVGSKASRHIYRSNAFINQPRFTEWQSKLKAKDPRRSLKGQLEKLDEDDIDEFVVRDRNNRIVAVNGFTTKASDYPIELEYYKANTTEAERKNVSMNQWLMSHYQPEMKIDPNTGLPSEDYYKWRSEEMKDRRINKRIPAMTPVNVFKNTFAYDLYQEILLNTIKTKLNEHKLPASPSNIAKLRSEICKGCIKQTSDKMWVGTWANHLFDRYIKHSVLQRLKQSMTDKNGEVFVPYEKYRTMFIDTEKYKTAIERGDSEETIQKMFSDYLFNKSLTKDFVKGRIVQILQRDHEQYTNIRNFSMDYIGSIILNAVEAAMPTKGKKGGPRPRSPAFSLGGK